MTHQAEPTTTELLAGAVQRVTFHNVESGFCVLRVKARGHRDLVTIVGHAASISAGEWLTASEKWINDRTHGQQFKARFLKTSAPTTAEGIEKYLASGMIRGIGPAYAKKMVATFGKSVFDTIEDSPDRLREVPGIGPVRAARIIKTWADQKAVQEVMVFLHSHGVGTSRGPSSASASWELAEEVQLGTSDLQAGALESGVHHNLFTGCASVSLELHLRFRIGFRKFSESAPCERSPLPSRHPL